jgi:hypothetical protein
MQNSFLDMQKKDQDTQKWFGKCQTDHDDSRIYYF